MIGIVVCTHSGLAQGIKDAVEMIAGEQASFDVIGFNPGDDMLELSERLKEIAAGYERAGERYVFLVDLYGATPFNSSAVGLAEFDTRIIAGVNLPMLLELVMQRGGCEDYDEFIDNAVKCAKIGIRSVSMREMFKNK